MGKSQKRMFDDVQAGKRWELNEERLAAFEMINRYRKDVLGWTECDPDRLTPTTKGLISSVVNQLRQGHGEAMERAIRSVSARRQQHRPNPNNFFRGGWENLPDPLPIDSLHCYGEEPDPEVERIRAKVVGIGKRQQAKRLAARDRRLQELYAERVKLGFSPDRARYLAEEELKKEGW